MQPRTFKQIVIATTMTMLAAGALLPVAAQQQNQKEIWKQMLQLEKQAMGEMQEKNYRAAASSYFEVLNLANQLPPNDERLKTHFSSIEANLSVVDNSLESKSDMALKEKVLRARLPLVEKLYGKNSLGYQVGIKKLMFALSEQGKTAENATLSKELIRDTSGPQPAKSTAKKIGKPSARNR